MSTLLLLPNFKRINLKNRDRRLQKQNGWIVDDDDELWFSFGCFFGSNLRFLFSVELSHEEREEENIERRHGARSRRVGSTEH